jgi:hypothetical protein
LTEGKLPRVFMWTTVQADQCVSGAGKKAAIKNATQARQLLNQTARLGERSDKPIASR